MFGVNYSFCSNGGALLAQPNLTSHSNQATSNKHLSNQNSPKTKRTSFSLQPDVHVIQEIHTGYSKDP